MEEAFEQLLRLIEIENIDAVVKFMDSNNFTTDRCITMAMKYPEVHNRMFEAVDKIIAHGRFDILDVIGPRGLGYDFNTKQDELPLNSACADGNIDVVRSLIEFHGASPDQEETECKVTPLLAVLRSHIGTKHAMIQYLLTAGASVNKTDKYQHSPLHSAAEHCSVEICQLLISNGADVNMCDRNHASPLCAGVLLSRLDVVKCLLDAGANPNTCIVDGLRPFEFATRHLNLPMMEILFAGGADIEWPFSVGKTPLHYAVLQGDYEIVEYLIYEAGVCLENIDEDEDEDEASNSPFKIALNEGHEDIADLLVEAGYNPRKEELISDRETISSKLAEMIERWREAITTPRKLKELCINRIRRMTFSCRPLSSAVSCLPLPQAMKDEILRIK